MKIEVEGAPREWVAVKFERGPDNGCRVTLIDPVAKREITLDVAPIELIGMMIYQTDPPEPEPNALITADAEAVQKISETQGVHCFQCKGTGKISGGWGQSECPGCKGLGYRKLWAGEERKSL